MFEHLEHLQLQVVDVFAPELFAEQPDVNRGPQDRRDFVVKATVVDKGVEKSA